MAKSYIKHTLTAILFSALSVPLFSQNVAINTSGNAAYASAILDLSNQNTVGTLGLLPPYVTLTAINSFNPAVSGTPAQSNGIIVYCTGLSAVPAGLYYWNNTIPAWVLMGASLSGSGTLNYLARWTPNGTTLGIGVSQDNGITAAINTTATAPVATQMLTVSANTTAINGIVGSTTATGGIGVKGTLANSGASGGYAIQGLVSGNGGGQQYALYGASTVTAGNGYGVEGISTGATSGINYGGYFAATGGTSNYGLVIPPSSGFAGIGTITPGVPLDVQSGQVTGIRYLKTSGGQDARINIVDNSGQQAAGWSLTVGWASATAGDFSLIQEGLYGNVIYASHVNKFVGIYTSTPKNTFDVAGSIAVGSYGGVNAAPANGLIVSGNVGIGTNNPNSQLTVMGSGTGYADIGGNTGCGGNYTGISLNGLAFNACTNYNILSSPTDQNLYINRPTGSGIIFREANGTQMTVATGGYVAIGTANPICDLDVNGSGNNAIIHFAGSTAPTISIQGGFLGWNGLTGGTGETDFINEQGGGPGGFAFFNTTNASGWAGRTVPMIITGGGIVSIGCTTPPAMSYTYLLYVNGNSAVRGTSYALAFNTVTGVSACSDVRYKKDITVLPNALANVLKLRGVNYYWKKEEFPEKQFDDKLQVGFIAQELEKVYPQMVVTDEHGYKSVDYSRLTPVLVEAVKDQQKIIDSLSAKINALTAVAATQSTQLNKYTESQDSRFKAEEQQITELKQMIYSLTKVEASAK